MTPSIVKHGLIPREYDIFAGLDVDKMSISVTFLNHEAQIKRNSRASGQPCQNGNITLDISVVMRV